MKNGSYFPGRGTLVEETFLAGKAAGLAKARAEARAEAEAARLAWCVLRSLEIRGISVDEEQRARVKACTDPDVLDRWLERTFHVVDADQMFEGEPAAEPGR
ncbi:hypothetical protein [Streptomyces sp. PU-14G]|uniref:hypothetical protein n=1 Tax=Streptomyces sp. PU-14G TaxID=2800808 RepID=UPI0034DEA82E